MRVLVVNTGSSSLKLTRLDADGSVTALDHRGATGRARGTWRRWRSSSPRAARSTPSGTGWCTAAPGTPRPALVDDLLVAYLYSISHLAPLHNPRALAGIRAVRDLLPDVPDRGLPSTPPSTRPCRRRPAPTRCRASGTSGGGCGGTASTASPTPHAVRRGRRARGPAGGRPAHRHLRTSGPAPRWPPSADGVSVDTTMGFTPLAGLVMNTRPGTVDPGLAALAARARARARGRSSADVLEHHSGLKGLSGTSGDLRDVLAGRAAGDADCALAFDVYVHRLVREIAAMTAATGGLDLLVLTGGSRGALVAGARGPRRRRWLTSGWRSTRSATGPPPPTPTSPPRSVGAHRRRHRPGGPRDPPSGAGGARGGVTTANRGRESGPRPVVVLLRIADAPMSRDSSHRLRMSGTSPAATCWSTTDRSSGSRASHSTVKEPLMTLISTTTPPVGTR